MAVTDAKLYLRSTVQCPAIGACEGRLRLRAEPPSGAAPLSFHTALIIDWCLLKTLNWPGKFSSPAMIDTTWSDLSAELCLTESVEHGSRVREMGSLVPGRVKPMTY